MSADTERLKNDESKDERARSPQWFQERAERNRQRALLLKKSKIVAHPYSKNNDADSASLECSRFKDRKLSTAEEVSSSKKMMIWSQKC